MTPQLPKLRHDVELHVRATDAGSVTLVKDPVSGAIFRLKEIEAFIARSLDGATPVDVIRRRLSDELGVRLPRKQVDEFVASLERNGLLTTGPSPLKRKRIAGNLLFFRIPLVDPDRLLTRLEPHVRPCFTPTFVFLSSCLIAAAVAVLVFDWMAVSQAAARLYTLSTLPLLIVTGFFVVTLHELAHGLACKRFGGEVREIGFLMMYFQPALYCDVSDAWLFPEKGKRLWVGFAGPFLELVVWALATFVWRLTDAEAGINDVALVVMLTSGVKTLLNFNPLIKLDGYYLLSDYLDIANLRKKSFDYVGNLVKRAVGLEPSTATDYTRRERRVFLAYGGAAALFSFLLLGYVGLTVGDFLLEQDQRALFVAFAGVVGTRFRIKLRRLFRPASRASATGRAAFLRRKRRAVLPACAAALVAALLLVHGQLRVTGPVDVLPFHNADVRAEVDGVIAEIYVDEGDRVRPGDVVARLSDREQQAELLKTEAEIDQVRARLALLEAGPTPEQINVARTAVMKAEDRLEFARLRLSRDTELFHQQLLSRYDFDASRELESTAKNELAQARSQLEVLLKGTRIEEIEAVRAELLRLEEQRRYVGEKLRLTSVESPAGGIVTTPSLELKARVRQAVQRGDLIAKVYELDTVMVQVAIPEREIAGVGVGQEVAVKVRAYPGRIFHGRVTRIATTVRGTAPASASPVAAFVPAAVGETKSNVVLAMTATDNRDGLLKPGMTGVAKIYCGERRWLDLVLRRLSLTFRVEFWSWW